MGLLLIRVIMGSIMLGHAARMLLGLFGGEGVKGTAAFMEAIGIKPGVFMAISAGLCELVGGLLFGLGLWTWIGAVILVVPMIVAIAKFHGPKGLWAKDNGFEYNVIILSVLIGVALTGGGSLSLDALIART